LNLDFRLPRSHQSEGAPGLNFIDITTKISSDIHLSICRMGSVVFTDEEAADLGKYLLNGAFSWRTISGRRPVGHLREQMAHVLPHREPVDCTDESHLHTVYDFKQQPKSEVGAYQSTGQSWDPGFPYYVKSSEPHYYASTTTTNMVALLCTTTITATAGNTRPR